MGKPWWMNRSGIYKKGIVYIYHRDGFGRILRGTRVSILGHATSLEEMEKGKRLIQCSFTSVVGVGVQKRLEDIVKRAVIFVSVQCPKAVWGFVKRLRGKVEKKNLIERHTFKEYADTHRRDSVHQSGC
jgi:hypothetical protein